MGRVVDVIGDLRTFKADYIAHQCYCTNARDDAKGLAKVLFDHSPEVDVYKGRTEPSPPGIIEIRGNVIALFAQLQPGSSKTREDTKANRLRWFSECLAKVTQVMKPAQTIAIPKLIGCGLAGGVPEEYLLALCQFAHDLPNDCIVYLVSQPL
jgi:hypothetical protein